jgi:uncharacterized membrane protein YjfL (UPF0719 family)
VKSEKLKNKKIFNFSLFTFHFSLFAVLPFSPKNYIIQTSFEFLRTMNFIKDFRALLIGLWLGAAIFFIAVAQSSFAVLPSRELAGAVVSRTLMIINLSGLIIGAILLAASFIKQTAIKPFLVWTERILLVLLIASCAVNQFVVGSWLFYVRSQFGGKPIDEIAADDPLKIQFNTLHEYSVWILFAGMIAALLAFFIILRKPGVSLAVEKKDEFKFDKF